MSVGIFLYLSFDKGMARVEVTIIIIRNMHAIHKESNMFWLIYWVTIVFYCKIRYYFSFIITI